MLLVAVLMRCQPCTTRLIDGWIPRETQSTQTLAPLCCIYTANRLLFSIFYHGLSIYMYIWLNVRCAWNIDYRSRLRRIARTTRTAEKTTVKPNARRISSEPSRILSSFHYVYHYRATINWKCRTNATNTHRWSKVQWSSLNSIKTQASNDQRRERVVYN